MACDVQVEANLQEQLSNHLNFRQERDVLHYNLQVSFFPFLGEMQRIAFRLMLSSCVCVFVSMCMPRLWTSGKRFEIDRFSLNCADNTRYNLQEFDTNRNTNSKVADKMAAVKKL